MANTKIICTIGPSSRNSETILKMLNAGMDIARFNMSHDNQSVHGEAVRLVRETAAKFRYPLKVMIDLRGPEIRLSKFDGGFAVLESGSYFTLTTRTVTGGADIAQIFVPQIADRVSVGDRIFLGDGIVELCVTNIINSDILCRVVSGGRISDNKSVNFPGVDLGLPYLSESDKSDISFAAELKADMIALSFVSCTADIFAAREFLGSVGGAGIKLIAKIENQRGVDNIDEIIKAADGIMIARGDLGAEIPLEKLPHIQKQIICRCLDKDRFVITATEMLESMTEKSRPTRAEATDVANAVYDGTDAVMLSGETANGRHPALAVEYMYKLVDTAEHYIISC